MGIGGRVALICCGAGLLIAQSANASTIPVTTTADEYGSGANCSLREAIHAAFVDATFGGCQAGEASGQDVIRLVGGKTYALTRPRSGAETEGTGDLDVYAAVDIVSTGNGLATVDASAANSRVFHFNVGASEMEGIRVQGGHPNEGGGGIFVSSSLFVEDSVISGNHTTAGGSGGGLANTGSLSLLESTVSGNQTPGDGGGIEHEGSLLSVVRSTISGNTASSIQSGGGINVDPVAAASLLLDATVSGNHAGVGGGISSGGGITTINDATVTNNRADTLYGGLQVYGGSATAYNTILAGNQSPDASDDCNGTLFGSYNLIQVLSGCTYFPGTDIDVVGKAPKLGALADNGGPVRTHALLPGSPAINAGKPGSGTGECLELDARPVDRALGGRCDMGAYELVRCADTIVNRVGTFAATETVIGTAGADGFLLFDGQDVAKGLGGPDRICGGPGNDKLIGGKGNDRLFGENGKDKLIGGRGRDKLVGGPGRDRCLGGPGRDRARSCARRIGIP
jgi:CSLREA domain-containing protein